MLPNLSLFCSVEKSFNVALATSLVQHFPPKHHARALRIIDQILQQDADNVPSLMCRGYIYQHIKNWTESASLFSRVIELSPADTDNAVRAKEEHAWCMVQLRALEQGVRELQDTLSALLSLEGKEEDKARCQWRLGKAHWEMGGSYSISHLFHSSFVDPAVQREIAYDHFIKSLKYSPTFAPAFTSLGLYYLEAAGPPDPNRASKCFQKAFELDAREAEAARRLAEGFAEEREWDLVEVVAKRAIEGEGGLGDGMPASGGEQVVPGRYLPTNAWAWKAVGVVDLVGYLVLIYLTSRADERSPFVRTDGTSALPSSPFRLLFALIQTISSPGSA